MIQCLFLSGPIFPLFIPFSFTFNSLLTFGSYSFLIICIRVNNILIATCFLTATKYNYVWSVTCELKLLLYLLQLWMRTRHIYNFRWKSWPSSSFFWLHSHPKTEFNRHKVLPEPVGASAKIPKTLSSKHFKTCFM